MPERRLFRWLVAVEVLLVAAHVLAPAVHRRPRLLDLNMELSIAGWFSSLQLAAVALVFGLIAADRGRERPPGRPGAALLAAAFLFLSLDEAVALHEQLAHLLRAAAAAPGVKTLRGGATGHWILPYLGCLAGLLLVLRRDVARIARGERAAARHLAAGLALLVLGAAGLEWVKDAFLAGAGHRGAIGIEVVAEEFAEMLGVTFVLRGALMLRGGAPAQRPDPTPV